MDTDTNYPEDRQLVERIRAGDHGAVETLLFDMCSQSLFCISRDYNIEYEDLLANVYVHLRDNGWHRLNEWEGRCSLRRWVANLAIRLCLDEIRKKLRRSILLNHDLVSLVEDPSSDGDAARLEARRGEVLRAIDELPSRKEQLLVLMHCFMGLPIEETAKTLDVSTQNAYQIKSRAIKHLRLILERRLADVDS